MTYIDSMIYCSQLSMSRDSSTGDFSSASTPINSPCSSLVTSFLQKNIYDESTKSPVEAIAKKRGVSYQNLTISTSSIKRKSIYLRSPKVSSSNEYSDSPYSLTGSPSLRTSISLNSSYSQSSDISEKIDKKPIYMLPIFKPILVTSNNYISSTPSYFKIIYNQSRFKQSEFSFIPVNDKYSYIKNYKDNSYSCHGVKFSKSKSILNNSKGTTILNLKKREILNNNKEKICEVNYLNKLDEHFKIIFEISNKFDNEKVTIVCVCDAYNQIAYIYNNYPDKGGNVIGYISRMNNLERKINHGWVVEITAKVDIPLIMAITVYNLKNFTEVLEK